MAEPRCSQVFAQLEPQLFLFPSRQLSPQNMLVIQIGVLLPAGNKLSVLKHSFAQEILVTLLQHGVCVFQEKLAFTFAFEAEPQSFLACS